MDLEQTVRRAFALCEPPADFEDVVMARVAAGVWRASRVGRRKPSRTILFGTILAVAAAAALLAARLHGLQAPQPAAVATSPAAIADAAPQITAPSPSPAKLAPTQTRPLVKPFTVRVALREPSTEETDLDPFYAAFVARLRVVPGLTLIGPVVIGRDPAEVEAEERVDYRVTLTAGWFVPEGSFTGNLGAFSYGSDGTSRADFRVRVTGSVTAPCGRPAPADLSIPVLDASSCSDPASTAAYLVWLLRKKMFPPDSTLQRQLQAQLFAQGLSARQRLSILQNLAALTQRSAVELRGNSAIATQADATFVQGAIDLAETTTDPALRAQIWRLLRGVHRAELLSPLIDASRRESDGETRLAAVATLAADFAGDEPGRAALEAVASQDSRALVRAVAQRGLSGEDAWKQYVVESLKDRSRPDTERVEALIYHLSERRPTDAAQQDSQRIAALLGDEGMQELAQVLPRLRISAQLSREALGQLVLDVTAIDHPAITAMLLDNLREKSDLRDGAKTALSLLDHPDREVDETPLRIVDGRAREVLLYISMDNRDQQQNEKVAAALRAARSPAR